MISLPIYTFTVTRDAMRGAGVKVAYFFGFEPVVVCFMRI